jgi:PucR family transcriptional regulator, purine catabolism regulatory protein
VISSTGFNVAESARILHYHYNTMRYRVTKLERLLGEFPGDAAAALRIGVALQILVCTRYPATRCRCCRELVNLG